MFIAIKMFIMISCDMQTLTITNYNLVKWFKYYS